MAYVKQFALRNINKAHQHFIVVGLDVLVMTTSHRLAVDGGK